MKKILLFILLSFSLFGITSCIKNGDPSSNKPTDDPTIDEGDSNNDKPSVDEPVDIIITDTSATNKLNDITIYFNERYTSADEVALYIIAYQELPINYFTKAEFKKLEEKPNKENKYSVGGDRFYNREGLLPEDDIYYECDIDYNYSYRNALRIVFSIESLDIYYTNNHYASFVQLYDDGIYLRNAENIS